MSRIEHDNYPTPSWVTARLLDAVDGLGDPRARRLNVLEPSAGEGALIRACMLYRAAKGLKALRWHAVELRPSCAPILRSFKDIRAVDVGRSFLDMTPQHDARLHFDLAVMNPPFKHALAFVQHALRFAPMVYALLPITFVQQRERCAFIRSNTPDVFIIPERPRFKAGGGDRVGVAWYRWTARPRKLGSFCVLPSTPGPIRKGLAEDTSLMITPAQAMASAQAMSKGRS